MWLDEHQQGSNGARIFVMPATDPINPNVHPLIYRWNGILGQSQAAALEAAGKEGIIYNSTYTNFWQGAMAWSGWWHNQIGLLTEVASVRVAAPIEQQRAVARTGARAAAAARRRRRRRGDGGGMLPPPTDTNSRTEYPRPWMGGRWTLRDIVDYELIATMALLDTVADRREALLQQIYEVNRVTIENGKKGDPAAILIPVETQHDPHEAMHLVEKLQMAGVEVYRADAAFEADGQKYAAGTFVIPMAQVFARYAKDMLEKQTYPEVRRSPTSPPEPPYDVTRLVARHAARRRSRRSRASRWPTRVKLTKLDAAPKLDGKVTGNGRPAAYVFDYRGPDAAKAINRLLKDGARVALDEADARVGAERAAQVARRGGGRARPRRSRPRTRAAPAGALRGQGAAHRHVLAVDRRQHGRGLDALGARAVRLQPDDAAQRRRPRRQAAREVRRRSSCPTRSRARSSTAPAGRTSAPSTAAASATKGSPRCASSSAQGGTLVTLGAAVRPRDRALRRAAART